MTSALPKLDDSWRAVPPANAFRHFSPRNLAGGAYLSLALASTGLAAVLASSEGFFVWFLAQLLFALAFLQWFTLIHEAVHYGRERN